MRKRILPVVFVATLFGVVAVAQNSAPAAAAAMKSKSEPKASAGGAITVKVINWRNTDLVELQATKSGSADWKKVLGPLKAGQWTTAKLPQADNCRVDLRGKYANGQSADASNVDVCADKSVDLTN